MADLDQLKLNFGGDLERAVAHYLESEVTAPSTRALIEWLVEERSLPTEVYMVSYSDYDGGGGVSVHRTPEGAQKVVDKERMCHYYDKVELED